MKCLLSCCGLALLTKGEAASPIVVVSMGYLLLMRRSGVRNLRFYCAALVALAIPLAWFGCQ